MTDSRIMPREEREILIHMLNEIDPKANYTRTLEEEVIDAYETTVNRLKAFKDKEYARFFQRKSAPIEFLYLVENIIKNEGLAR